jgi:Domain of unknown function (DUF1844)
MSDTDKPYTVSDRRHFTPEGRAREEEAEAARPAAPEETRTASGETPPAGDRSEALGASPDPVELSQFLLSLGAQAGALLSGQGLPEGADEAQALDAARSIIGILEMLQDKTEGRRTSEESALLEGLLFELRMGYVEKTRARST